jgi:hypothetical protein
MTIMNPLEHLIYQLEEVRQSEVDYELNYDSETNRYFIDLEYKKINEISKLASWELFSERGRLQFAAKAALQRAGFTVIQVRASKEGWLIAGIVIPTKGVIAFENDYLMEQKEIQEKQNREGI